MNSDKPNVPPHIEDTVRSIAELHATHDLQTSLSHRAIVRLTEQLGQPKAIAFIAVIMLLWIGINIGLSRFHGSPFDSAPFPYLQSVVSAAALFMTVLILTSQRHENRLAEQRAQLTLELAMVSEQKIAKLIELVEHQRRDNPQITNHVDEEAAAMAKPSDAQAMLEAIKETHSELIAEDNPSTK